MRAGAAATSLEPLVLPLQVPTSSVGLIALSDSVESTGKVTLRVHSTPRRRSSTSSILRMPQSPGIRGAELMVQTCM